VVSIHALAVSSCTRYCPRRRSTRESRAPRGKNQRYAPVGVGRAYTASEPVASVSAPPVTTPASGAGKAPSGVDAGEVASMPLATPER
jgi:hypothetical protein